MPEEIREYMMGHKLKDRVREAYFLTDPDELMKAYLRLLYTLQLKKTVFRLVWMSSNSLKVKTENFKVKSLIYWIK
jgi:hypothetical protein